MNPFAQKMTMSFLSTATLAVVVAYGQSGNRPEPGPVSAQVAVECVSEDSVGCTWHAERHGNGSGLSFDVSLSGVVTYHKEN